MFIATVDVYLLYIIPYNRININRVIPYNRININHDRINLNLVGAPNCRGPLVLELTLTTVRYATGPNSMLVNETFKI
jgi:hypothetical protein